jgi:hypothetical protein
VSQHRSVLENKDFVTWANENCVVLVGHDGATGENKQHEPVEATDPKTKEKHQVCPLYDGLTCDEHKAIRRAASSPPDGYPKIDVPSGFPNSWIVGPDGVVEKIEPADQQAAGKIQELLQTVQKRYEAKPLAFKKWDGYRKSFADGDKALADQKWRAALAAYAKVDADAKKLPPGMADQVKAKVEGANTAVAARFDELKNGDGDAAAKLKGVKALRAEVGQKFSSGNLACLADIDAWIKEQAAAAAPAK